MKAILVEQGKSNGSSIQLISIAVTTAPTTTTYVSGDSFDPTGMVVTATYGISGVAMMTGEITGYVVTPTTLTDGVTSVTISYTEGGITCTTTQAVTVKAGVKSISVTTQPTTTSYEYGDTLSTSGMVVTGTYSDGSSKTVTGYTCSPTSLTTVGTQTITVSYTEDGVTKTTTFSVTVTKKKVSKPTWAGSLTYTGSSYSVSSTSYWNNYNTTYMTIGGTTAASDAGTYTATFTLKSNYQWSDGTTSVLSVSWSIAQASYTLSVSSSSVDISADNYSSGVTVTVSRSNSNATGVISAVSSDTSVCTVSVSGTSVTIKGDGSTAGTAVVTVSATEESGSNFTSPEDVEIQVTAKYDIWGDETEEGAGNAEWWATLQDWVLNDSTAEERADCVGKTKSITLTTAVQGTTTHLVRCIGADQDGTNTLTFQTKNCLSITSAFDLNGRTAWINSTARTLCQNYYSYFPGKSYIKTVSKGTCTSVMTGSRNYVVDVSYNNETVWLPSEMEMGLDKYSPMQVSVSTTSNAECYAGTKNTGYDYYNSNSSRIKYLGDSSSSAQNYWERSRDYYSTGLIYITSSGGEYYYSSTYACGIAPAFVIG